MKEKIRSFILIIIITLPFFSFYSLIQYRKFSIRNEFRNSIRNSADEKLFVTLKFHKEEINKYLRFEHSDEFEFNSKMYDVIKRTVAGDSVYFICYSDDEESYLNKILISLVSDSMSKDPISKEKINRTDDFYKSLYFSKTNWFENLLYENSEYNLFFLHTFLSQVKSKVFKPPKYSFV